MDAYYYGFDRTGCGPVDAVLSAVAIAGKGSHNTDGWTNRDVYGYYDKRPGLPANPRIDDWTGGSAVELIQLTAKASAEKVKSLSDDLAALISEVERLRAERDGDGDVESGTLWHAQRDVSRLRNELHQIEALRRKAEIRCESLEAQIDAVDGLHRKTPVYDTFADDCEEHDPEEHAIEGLDSSVAGPSTVSSIDW